jgi:RES domain-containing protein
MNPEKQLVKVLKKILAQTTPQNYRSFRSTNLKYVTDPLSALGSALAGGRFNPKGFEALYTSLEIETMIAEMQHYANTDPRLAGRFRPSSILTLEATGLRVLDLSNSEAQSALGTNTQELSGNFIRMQNRGLESPTQTLGRINMEHQLFDAVIAESARQDNGKNLVIFSDVADLHNCTVTVFDPENVLPTIQILPKAKP